MKLLFSHVKLGNRGFRIGLRGCMGVENSLKENLLQDLQRCKLKFNDKWMP